MCGICGCSSQNSSQLTDHQHHHEPHDQHHLTEQRRLHVELDLLTRNNRFAEQNRATFAEHGILALNLVSSPGAGKTTLLVETLNKFPEKEQSGVIEGDQQTRLDAERIEATGVATHQINTGRGCHLDAHQIGHALEHFDMNLLSTLFIENVGNLVCPSAFDLGEQAKVVVLSVTEGDDKPLKYPDMFQAASLMLINKIDLLPYVDFDVAHAIEHARRINPEIEAICISAKTGENMNEWLSWITAQHASDKQAP